MLNITMHNEPDLATFVLDGKLSGAWVDEFQHCYHMLSVFPHEKSVVVDLSGVTSIDAAGEDLLLQIRQDGAQLVAGVPPGELSSEQIRSLSSSSIIAPSATRKETAKSKTIRTSSVIFKNVLFATDFSPSASSALPYAVAAACRYGAKIYVGHVIPIEAYLLVKPGKRDAALGQAEAYVAQRMSALLKTPNLEGLACQALVAHGEVWPMLAEMVAKHGIDLIVIGTRGRRGVRKLLLGSVAEEIYHLAGPPVLTVGPNVVGIWRRDASLLRILYATDLSPESVPAMDYAWSLSTEFQAKLLVAHISERGDQSIPEASIELREFFQTWQKTNDSKKTPGAISPEFVVEVGSPADRILEMASEQRVDLIVLGMRGVRRTQGRIFADFAGMTADKIVSGSSCPVLTIRQKLRNY